MTAEEMAEEIRRTWDTARSVNGQMEAFRILERMVDRLGYGRRVDNPSLAKPSLPNHESATTKPPASKAIP